LATIEDLYNAFKQVKLREDLPQIIQATSYEINILVINQLRVGKLSTRDPIRPAYASTYYANMKQAIGSEAAFKTPDIKLTGAYYAALGVSVTQDEYDIESTVPYADSKQILQYGDDLLRLSEDSKQIYCDETLGPAIQSYITEKTGLTFN
jgi:hypothetical protein